MPFVTQENLEARFGEKDIIELTDRSVPRTGEVSTEVLDKAMLAADGMVRQYLTGVYDVAQIEADAPLELLLFAEDIAYYLLHKRATPEIAEKFNVATEYLRRVRTGATPIGPLAVSNTKPTGTQTVLYCSPGRRFTDSKVASYMSQKKLNGCQ